MSYVTKHRVYDRVQRRVVVTVNSSWVAARMVSELNRHHDAQRFSSHSVRLRDMGNDSGSREVRSFVDTASRIERYELSAFASNPRAARILAD